MSDDNQGPRVHPECPRCGDVKTENMGQHEPCWRCVLRGAARAQEACADLANAFTAASRALRSVKEVPDADE